jgi:hypothetical protein
MAKEEKGFSFLAPLVVVVFLLVIGVGAYFVYQKSSVPGNGGNNQEQPVACTQEAKICPDGSSVGRIGPNCEFTECPADKTANWKVYSNTEYGFTFKYPEKLESKFFNLQEPIITKSAKTDKNIKNGCYVGGEGPKSVVRKQAIKINNIDFCFSQSYDAGAGSGANYYYYTFLKDNNYFTINFQIRQPNSCGPYYETENQDACQKDFQNFQTIVDQPLLDSLATLKFLGQVSKEQSCINSGGKVETINCYCSGAQDFFNNCLVGACTCTPNPANLKQVKSCSCGENECFNGTSCVARQP